MAERPAPDEGDYAELVRGLLNDLSGTSITRLDLRHGELRVALRRTPGQVTTAAIPAHTAGAPEAGRPAHWHAVEAPMTGIFYAQPTPDDEPYVEVGGFVDATHVVGLIEAMKLFNEITADVAGTVREIVAENGALVESGQALLYIEPGEDIGGPPIGAV